MELKDCQSFVASVQQIEGKFYVEILGKGLNVEQDLEFEIKKLKEFPSKKDCMEFFTDYSCIDYRFDEDDFIFVSNRWVPIFGRGVDFDES